MSGLDSPFLIFAMALIAQCLAVYAGHLLRQRRPLEGEEREDFDLVRNATLTLLALIIGFSFAMAVSRYDQRKNYEEAEANAIGTELVRADLLPAEGATRSVNCSAGIPISGSCSTGPGMSARSAGLTPIPGHCRASSGPPYWAPQKLTRHLSWRSPCRA
jgi:hypothetical protein